MAVQPVHLAEYRLYGVGARYRTYILAIDFYNVHSLSTFLHFQPQIDVPPIPLQLEVWYYIYMEH